MSASPSSRRRVHSRRLVRRGAALPAGLLVAGLLAAGLLLFTPACDITSVNDDPTKANTIDPAPLFTRGLLYASLRYDVYQRSQHLFGNLYAQYFSNLVPSFPTGRYEAGGTYDDWATSFWSASYGAYGGGANVGENVSNFGTNTQQVIDLTEDEPKRVNQTAQARIWKVFILHRVTDWWGSVPYFEAYSGNPRPAYDSQEAIYRDMLATLDSAAAALDPSITADAFRFGEADVLYNDDLEKWQRFAQSLRLRLAMRTSEVAPELARRHAQDAVERGVMQSNDQSARMPMFDTGEFVNQNPLGIIQSFDDDRVSEKMVSTLKTHDDPRLPVYADTIFNAPRDTVAFRGLPNGLSSARLSQIRSINYSRVGSRFRQSDFPVPILLQPEVRFLRAEAALRGFTSESAQEQYEKGIRASLEMYGITDEAQVQAYLDEDGVAWEEGDSDDEKLEKIIRQKWLAIFTQGNEAWATYRRTGYPELLPIPSDGNTGGEVPSRILYISEEYNLNEENVTEAAQRIGGDQMTTNVWWDVN